MKAQVEDVIGAWMQSGSWKKDVVGGWVEKEEEFGSGSLLEVVVGPCFLALVGVSVAFFGGALAAFLG